MMDDSLDQARRRPAPLACCPQACNADLVLAVESALFRMALRGVKDAGWPSAGPRPMATERAIEVLSPIQGLLVLRCDEALTGFLCRGVDKGRDLGSLLLARVSERCVKGGGKPWQCRPHPGQPGDWPRRRPDQARAIMVGAEAIELRFWAMDWGSGEPNG